MFGLGKNKDGASYAALIDIGSGSIGIGIIESIHTEQYPTVIFSQRIVMRTGKVAESVDSRMRKMREALFTATLTLSRDGIASLKAHNAHAHITNILATCASPWGKTILRNISYNHDGDDVKITRELIADLTESAEHEIESLIEESQIIGSAGLHVIERATVDVQVNGYKVNNPIGLKGQHISLAHITGIIPEEILEVINEVQEKVLTQAVVNTHTSMMVMYCVLRDVFPDVNSLSIVDVTGEATEIGIVENGILSETRYVPYGVNTLLRSISAKTNNSLEGALSLLHGYSEKTLSENEHRRVETLMEEYVTHLETLFEKAMQKHTIPKKMVVTSLGEYGDLYRERILRVAEKKTGGTYTQLAIDRNKLCDNKSTASKSDIDIYLAIAARFYHKMHDCALTDD